MYADPGQATPCEVLYDKPTEGSQSTPWRASNQAGYCEEKADLLVRKLEGLGWSCGTADSGSEVSSEGSDAG